MKIQLDLDVCEGNGVCVRRAPGIFELGDDGLAVLLEPRPSAERRDEVQAAASLCPTQAITLTEDDA